VSDVAEVATLGQPLDISMRPPGSKSETIRALVAAALADGRSHLYAPLRADDTMAMAGALHSMGIGVESDSEPWAVDGAGGWLSQPEHPLDAHESGLSARILLALAGSRDGVVTIQGRGRLPERPMRGIVDVLREQGVEVGGDRLPIEVAGHGHLWGGHIAVDCSESSQFATAVMLVAPLMEQPCVLEVTGLSGSAGYLEGTASIMRRFGASLERTVTGYEIANDGYRPSDVVVEPDASAAAYPMAVAAITGGRVTIEGLGRSSWQPDLAVASILEQMGCDVGWENLRLEVDATGVELGGVEVDMSRAPDGALALAVVCLFAAGPSRISGLGSLRHKESDRLQAVTEEMRRIGGRVEIAGDSLLIEPGPLHGAVIDSHGDHRIAMSLATAGTRVSGIAIGAPQVVDKTWPEFWDFLDSLPR
jgi:3-phosphoshikimate 1-carboxyvinyltransferase